MAENNFPTGKNSLAVIAEVQNLRVIVITLEPGQDVPWHYHTSITDTFFCLEGPMVVEYGTEGESAQLNAGDHFEIQPRTPHRTSGANQERCKFLVVQGIGEYDFVPLDS